MFCKFMLPFLELFKTNEFLIKKLFVYFTIYLTLFVFSNKIELFLKLTKYFIYCIDALFRDIKNTGRKSRERRCPTLKFSKNRI